MLKCDQLSEGANKSHTPKKNFNSPQHATKNVNGIKNKVGTFESLDQ